MQLRQSSRTLGKYTETNNRPYRRHFFHRHAIPYPERTNPPVRLPEVSATQSAYKKLVSAEPGSQFKLLLPRVRLTNSFRKLSLHTPGHNVWAVQQADAA